ncbi:MAG: hypothetical protein K2G26_01845, partial [Clostridia bacterium]|nr:hypothetical protein [Clostridia bacterium]
MESLFDGLDKTAIKTVDKIETYCFSYQKNGSHPQFQTVGAFLSTTATSGKFSINSDCAQPQNTKTGVMNGPNNNFEVDFNTTDNVNTNGIVEYAYGDKLFLLDYYDINNRDYGFVNADGKTYIEFLGGTYAQDYAAQGSSYGLPSGMENDDTPFISDGFAMPTVASMWLRNFGRRSEQNSAFRGMLELAGNGYIFAGTSASKSAGIRPAFVFDATKIAYATAVAPTNAMADLSVVPSKPAYKLYFKDANFDNTSSGAKATVKDNNGTLSISYNNPTTISNGKLVLLLSDKTKNDGSIAYQTAMSMGVTGSDTTALANVTLPAGVSLSTHNVSLIYTTDNGGNKPENIYCSYTTDSGIDAPQNFDAGKYDNTSKWIGDLQTKPAWWDTNIHGNNVFVTVDSVEYTNAKGELKTDKTYTTADIKDAGTYKVTLKLANGLKWSDNTTANKSFTITIKRADPTVTAEAGKNNLYDTEGLPTNQDGTANVTNTAEKGTPGTFTWNAGQTPSPGTPEYTCTFTPTDDNNFNTKDDCSVSITFIADEVAGVTASVSADGTGTDKLYTSYNLEKLKAAPFSLVVKLVYESGLQKATADYTLSVLKDGSPQDYFHAGTNTVQVESNGYDCSFTVEVIAAEIDSIKSVAFAQNGKTIYPDTPLDDLEDLFTVQAYWNYNTSKFETLDKDNFKLDGTLVPGKGTSTLFIVYTKGGAEVKYPVPVGALNNITVDYLTYDMDGVELTGDKTVTYDGNTHALTLTGTLPDGVTAGTITYTKQGGTPSTTAPTDAGTYTVTVSFTGDTVNYKPISDITATLKIDKASYTMPTGYDETKQVTYTGSAISLPTPWIENLPTGVHVTYCEADGTTPFTAKTAIAKYTVKAVFTVDDPTNYEEPETVTLTFEITDKKTYKPAVKFESETFTYDGQSHFITIDDESALPDWITVEYYWEDGTTEFKGATNVADSGKVIAKFTHNDPEYADIPDMTATITINPADYDMSGITFEDKREIFNGDEYTLKISGELPTWITVTYSVEGQSGTEFSAAGEYKFTATFTHSDGNYNAIDDMHATLTISDAVVESISASIEDGAKFDINGTLDDVKAKIKAEIFYNNGTKESVKVEDLTVTCATLREGGLLEVGKQTITVKYADGIETTVEIEVAKAKVALPVYNGSLAYTGDVVKPAASDFEGYDSALMALVENKTVAGLNAGAYKAVFALKDSERYEWATA